MVLGSEWDVDVGWERGRETKLEYKKGW